MWIRALSCLVMAAAMCDCSSASSAASDSGLDRDAPVARDSAPPRDATQTDTGTPPTSAEIQSWIDAYKTAHPGNGGKDWDIIGCCAGATRTEAELQNDPDAVQLRSLCGAGQMPVIPQLAWEYGSDHPWINPEAAALVYCIYIPAPPGAEHWQYSAAADHVNADLYVLLPDENPCRDQVGANQVMACLGDVTNVEVFVDTASFHDGADVGLVLSESTTDLYLILADGSKVLMYHGV